MPTDADYTITDLAKLTGLNVRTIRYWIAQGLVPASGESGPGAHYGKGHLDRLQLIKRLQGEFLPNAEIRRRITPLSDADVAEVLAVPATADPAKRTSSALEYVRSLISTPPSAQPARASLTTSPIVAEASSPAAKAPAPAATVGRVVQLGDVAQIEPETALATESESSKPPERSQWERLSLGPDIELHIRRPLSRIEQRRVERLITIARQVLGEDQS